MLSIGGSWQTEVGRLVCRWYAANEVQLPYNPSWMRDASQTVSPAACVSPLVLALDFANNLSPFAGRGWFERALEGFIPLPECPPEQRYRETAL
jgi:hypothetical protein